MHAVFASFSTVGNRNYSRYQTSYRCTALQGKEEVIHVSEARYGRDRLGQWRRTGHSGARRFGQSSPTTVRPPLFGLIWGSGSQSSIHAQVEDFIVSGPVFTRSLLSVTRSLWVSSRFSKVIGTLPFDVVPAEMQVTTNNVKYCKVLCRGKSLPAPCRVYEATSFSEYVAQQPKYVRRILSDCDLTETATQKLLSLLRFPGPVYGGTGSGLLNGLGTFGFVWGDISKANALLPIVKGHVPGAPLIMSSPVRRSGDYLLLFRICAKWLSIMPSLQRRPPPAAFIRVLLLG
jgi:hypothetical protein